MPLEKMRELLKGSLGRALEGLSDEDRLAIAWPVACGKAFADHGAVLGFTAGLLQVQVDDPTWRQQFFTVQGKLAADLTRIAGVKVTGIHWELKGKNSK